MIAVMDSTPSTAEQPVVTATKSSAEKIAAVSASPVVVKAARRKLAWQPFLLALLG